MKLVNAEFFLKKFIHNLRHYTIELNKTNINTPEFKVIRHVKNIFSDNIKYIEKNNFNGLPPGFPTHTKDINDNVICLGDRVTYDYEDNTSEGIIVFEMNAFRVHYIGWDELVRKPLLESTNQAKYIRMLIKERAVK